MKFDAAFIERRMQEHREWQEQAALELESAIVEEVLACYEAGETRIGRPVPVVVVH